MSETQTTDRNSPEDYVDALRELDGVPKSGDIAEETDRHFHTVNRMLDPERDDVPDTVSRQSIGRTFLYRLDEGGEPEDSDD